MTPDREGTGNTVQRLGQIGHHRAGRYIERPVEGMDGVYRCIWSRHVADGDTVPPIRVLPDNCADFIVTEDGRSWFVGPATRVDLPRLPPGTIVHGLRIEPHAIGALVDADPAELVDRRAAFDALLSSREARVLEETLRTGGVDHRLLHRLGVRVALDDRATRGIRLLASRTDRSVDEIASECAMSPRQFRRVVRQASGLTPKTVQRVSRLHRVLEIASHHPEMALSMIAAHAGYTDQSHLARDARRLADLTPLQLVEMYR